MPLQTHGCEPAAHVDTDVLVSGSPEQHDEFGSLYFLLILPMTTIQFSYWTTFLAPQVPSRSCVPQTQSFLRVTAGARCVVCVAAVVRTQDKWWMQCTSSAVALPWLHISAADSTRNVHELREPSTSRGKRTAALHGCRTEATFYSDQIWTAGAQCPLVTAQHCGSPVLSPDNVSLL